MGICKSIGLCIAEKDTLYIDNIIEFDEETVKISSRSDMKKEEEPISI